MNTLAINTLPDLSLPGLSIEELSPREQSLSQVTLLESTIRMRERADCPVAMGELLAGKYQLERVVGIGGMGVVVLAWHTELQQRVALKLLRESFAGHAEARERFRREARAAARIGSDHVVRVFDVATLDNGVPYMVMEYLEGENLRELLRKVGPLEEHEVASIVIQVCEALAEAHANEIVHRDLKPENIYLAQRADRPPLVKVLDFGVSKSLAANTVPHMKITPASMLRGSPAYMSPEQLDCKREFDARSDIWGAGVLIFELLTEHLPFRGETLPQVICAVLAGDRLPLSQYRPGVSPAMEAVLARCLTPLPKDRFRTAHQLALALAPLAATHDDWAARLRPHLLPSAAEAGAYGKAHIVGESVAAAAALLPFSATEPASDQTVSCAQTFAAAPADWPGPPMFRLPPRRKHAFGLSLAAGAAGAGAAALVVFCLIWASRATTRDPTARISAAAVAGQAQSHGVGAGVPATPALPPAADPRELSQDSASSRRAALARPSIDAPLVDGVEAHAPAGRDIGVRSSRARSQVRVGSGAPSGVHVGSHASGGNGAAERVIAPRAARQPTTEADTSPAAPFDPHALSDFGGRR